MPTQSPNVLVFFTDQQRWDTCGCYGENPMNLTPVLDGMARRGTLVRNSFTVQPVCGPARACFQTGRTATRNGVWHNGLALPPESETLGHLFAQAGYLTGYIGKWHLASTDTKPVPKNKRMGYEYWLAADVLEFTSKPDHFRLFDNNDQEYTRPGYRVDAQTDAVLDFLRERANNRNTPFFLFTSYLEPHFQNDMFRFVGPPGSADKYRECWIPEDLRGRQGDWMSELPDYYGCCASLDENLGRILAYLEKSGMDENTVVMFCSDHGCHFKTRNSEYKRSCHESSIHVPTVLQGPGFNRGKTVEELVSLLDWPVTLLDAAGIHIPSDMEGRSILPLLDGHAEDWPEEVYIQISESQVGRAVRTRQWKFSVQAPDKDPWKDNGSLVYQEHYLYDLQNDPHEDNNLVQSAELKEVREELAGVLLRRMARAGEPPATIVPAKTA